MRFATRRTVAIAVAIAAISGVGAHAQQAFPSKPIRLIVPYPAGGATDLVGRIVAERMGQVLGQSVVVENRPGAGTMIGANVVARSAPDGYTMLLGDTGTYAFNPTLYEKRITYDPAKDLAPVSMTGRVPFLLVVNRRALDVGSVKELIDAARKAPGTVNYAAPGPGSPLHLAMELFKQRVGIKVNPVPYKGGADALNDLLGGRIAVMFLDTATGTPHIKGGALTALGLASGKRLAILPEVMTIHEAGVADFDASAWNGLSVPAGTPPEIIAKLSDAARKALASQEVQKRFVEVGVEAAPSTPDEFGSLIRAEIGRWRTVIREAGIELN